ncbi:MAG: MarR family winged helix-turn-helix transcriptional regulator [Frisingicoccus sp.]
MSQMMTPEMQQFNYLASKIDAAYHEAAQKLGLSDSAMLILYTICNHGEKCLLSDIRKLSGTSKQTINFALRKLEAKGVVCLKAAAGRKKMVCLTKNGKVLANRTVVRLITIENDIFSSWPVQERKLYLDLIRKYLTSFQERIQRL